ncbi:MAG: chromate transporter [Oscillospiraceae bacterium]|nr:chromate transporter [Oscillospiraceae bacterium]
MILLRLFWEFFKTGLFTVGGGMATLPFLYAMGAKTGWFTDAMLADMVAVSESTPGPIGMNMATYVGYTTAGIPGAIVASLGLVVPSLIIITIIASMLGRFRSNKTVDAVFYGLRPCSVALIAAAGLMVARITFLNPEVLDALLSHGAVEGAAGAAPGLLLRWKEILLAGIILVLTRAKTKAKDLHPVVFIAASAVVGIVFSF